MKHFLVLFALALSFGSAQSAVSDAFKAALPQLAGNPPGSTTLSLSYTFDQLLHNRTAAGMAAVLTDTDDEKEALKTFFKDRFTPAEQARFIADVFPGSNLQPNDLVDTLTALIVIAFQVEQGLTPSPATVAAVRVEVATALSSASFEENSVHSLATGNLLTSYQLQADSNSADPSKVQRARERARERLSWLSLDPTVYTLSDNGIDLLTQVAAQPATPATENDASTQAAEPDAFGGAFTGETEAPAAFGGLFGAGTPASVLSGQQFVGVSGEQRIHFCADKRLVLEVNGSVFGRGSWALADTSTVTQLELVLTLTEQNGGLLSAPSEVTATLAKTGEGAYTSPELGDSYTAQPNPSCD